MMRAPAQADLRAKLLAWVPLDPGRAYSLGALTVRYPGRWEVASPAAAGGIAYARRLVTGLAQRLSPDLFVKVIPPAVLSHETQTARLGIALALQGIATPVLQATLELGKGGTAFVFNWLDGSPPRGTLDEMDALGAALARFHCALLPQDRAFQIVQRTQERLARLETLARSPLFRERWKCTGETETFALRMRDSFLDAVAWMAAGGGHPCHGDLNPGNLLLEENGEVGFLDLEDSLHTAVWPGFDLAKLVERLALVAGGVSGAGQCELEKRINRLLSAYRAAGGSVEVAVDESGQGRLAMAMRWHMGLAVLILTEHFKPTSAVCRAEISKFMEIDRLVQVHEAVL